MKLFQIFNEIQSYGTLPRLPHPRHLNYQNMTLGTLKTVFPLEVK